LLKYILQHAKFPLKNDPFITDRSLRKITCLGISYLYSGDVFSKNIVSPANLAHHKIYEYFSEYLNKAKKDEINEDRSNDIF
jgi:hypothetical protein